MELIAHICGAVGFISGGGGHGRRGHHGRRGSQLFTRRTVGGDGVGAASRAIEHLLQGIIQWLGRLRWWLILTQEVTGINWLPIELGVGATAGTDSRASGT